MLAGSEPIELVPPVGTGPTAAALDASTPEVAGAPPHPEPDAGSSKPKEDRPQGSPKPITLTLPIIQAVVNRNLGNIMKCNEFYKSEVLAMAKNELKFNVTFTIVRSGKVSDAKLTGDIAGTQIAHCFEGKVKGLRFPLQKDDEVSLTMPFGFDITR